MRIIKQVKLRFTEGTSDKVYEVDLCQSADDEYVVNFRFGKFGSRLREGTKTAFPVELDVAERMYERLVEQKTSNGYLDESSSAPQDDVVVVSEDAVSEKTDEPQLASPEQQARILNRLTQWVPNIFETEWPLSRVIWRAGQLRIKAALPLIARQISPNLDTVEQYSIAWAIARIGEKDGQSIAILEKLDDITNKQAVKRMIREARILCMSEADATVFLEEQKALLSPETQDKLGEEFFADYLKNAVFYKDHKSSEEVEILYSMSLLDSSVRVNLLDFSTHVKIEDGSFRLIRLLYKLSEVRQDAELYGTLVNRLEVTPCRTSVEWKLIGKSYQPVKKGVFSSKTKRYFKNRSVKNLIRMGEDGDIASFITLATGILSAASEDIPVNPRQEVSDYAYNEATNSYQQITRYAPRYGNLYCLTWILRGKSQRLDFSRRSRNWSYLAGTSPEDDVKELREEPYPELWNQAPDAIIHLLKQARLDEVSRFAHAIWRANPSFADEVQAADIVMFIGSAYADTRRLGIELVEQFWNPEEPNYELLEALVLCDLDEAREIGFTFLAQVIDASLAQPIFLARIFTSTDAKVHERIRGLYLGKDLPNIYKEIAGLFPAADKTPRSAQLAVESLSLLNDKQSAEDVEQSELDRLLASEDEESMWYALHCYRAYARAGREISEQIIIDAIESEHTSIRKQGVCLLESFSDDQLIDQADLIASCCASKSSELRQGILPVLERLVAAKPSFGLEMVESLYPVVVRKESSEGVHDDVLAILLGPLRSSLKAIPENSFRRMLKSKYAAAHVLGLHLLEGETSFNDEPLLQVIEWANHPHFRLRKLIISHLDENPERLMMQLSETRQIVESEWDEVREFGMDFLRNRVPEDRWTVEALVDLCDSVKPLVQDFGREMVTKRFREEDGEIYMTKLSQHPTREMQQFATHFLQQTASDKPEIILSLEFYFRTVMGAVSAGRVAKDRVHAFLKQEAGKNQDVAVMATQLWHDHAATCAIGDKAACIEAIMTTQRAWSEVNLEFYSELEIIEVEEREVRS